MLAINLLLAPHNPYQEKDSVFECGFHSFLGQNRTQFSVSFYVVAILFLIFDVELTVSYPYAVSVYNNDSYGLVIMMLFFLLLTLGFVFELGKNALTIDSRQTSSYNNVDTTVSHAFFNSAKAELVTTNVLTSSYEVRESTILMMVVLPIVALVINPDVYSEVVYFTQHLVGIFLY